MAAFSFFRRSSDPRTAPDGAASGGASGAGPSPARRPLWQRTAVGGALVAAGVGLGLALAPLTGPADTLEQLRKLEEAFMLISQQYVEPVDTEAVAEGAIAGMLEQLDPHSSYVAAKELREVQESFEGAFGGVGIYFEVVRDTARVINTIPNGPSERAGLMPGDRLVAIDDSTAIGIVDDGVRKRLKGEIGTTVRVAVERRGLASPRVFTLTRARIPIVTVESSFMADDQTGYIRIGYFAQTTYDEFRRALAVLRQQGMQRMVLDLRDNPGGIMGTAVQIADEFLPAGQTIVSTRSRNPRYNETERATPGGAFERQPLIVLVNANSASASEILAGALQDHDRALIVGRRTFGKGLVQTQFPLSDGSVLQMTIARYYTPVGRLIQTPYRNGESMQDYFEHKFEGRERELFDPSEYIASIPDSLKFRTDGGRTVFGGGGILPDAVVIPDTSSALAGIGGRGLDFRFAREYFEANEGTLRAAWGRDADRFRRDFRVDAALWQRFTASLQTGEDSLTFVGTPADVAPRRGRYLRGDLTRQRADLEVRVKASLARNLFGADTWYPIAVPVDPAFREAMQLWGRAAAIQTAAR